MIKSLSNIKLVIWDLDETFWKGTLSERGGVIVPIAKNIELLRDLTDRGIVNAICSKNDYEPAVMKLREFGVDEFFVFKSIDWTPKGQRVSKLIKDMGLRPVNCLFLDDNIVNLNEAQYYSKDLFIAEPSEIDNLIELCRQSVATDLKHKRLNQYKVLEKKQKAKAEASDNLQFLYSSNTRCEIHDDCKPVADRLFELIHRTNQLNFTKNRCSREEFDAILDDDNVRCGYVTVKDNFGDYGIVGFFAIRENHFLHFLFSCRTIGQGVEQWVYSTLGCPKLDVVGDVVNQVFSIEAPSWINQSTDISYSCIESSKSDLNTMKVVMKGPCDILSITSYLDIRSIIRELTYVGNKTHTTIEHHNHSVNYVRFPFLSDTEQKNLLNGFPFNDEDMFKTHLYDKDVKFVILSTLPETSLGVYKNKETGYKFAWGEWNRPLTDSSLWDFYINEKSSYNGNITLEWLREFSNDWEYVGRITPHEYMENLSFILKHMDKEARLCLILGSETAFDGNTQDSYIDRHKDHKEFNEAIREFANKHRNVHLVELTNYVISQSDFINNINHFQRRIYYQIAQDINKIIEADFGFKIKERSKVFLLIDRFSFFLRKLTKNSVLYKPLRKVYGLIRKGAFTAH